MNINAIGFGQATASDGTQAPSPEKPTGFAQALGVAQSGAPPGPPSPTTGAKVGEEVATVGPNAPSLSPDFFPLIQANVNVIVKPTADAGTKEAPTTADKMPTVVDPTTIAMAMAVASVNVVALPNPTVPIAQFTNPTAATPAPSLATVGSKPVSDPIPMPPTLAGDPKSPTPVAPNAAAEFPKASLPDPTVIPPPHLAATVSDKMPPTASNGQGLPPQPSPKAAPVNGQAPTADPLPTSATATVVVPAALATPAGQETATANAEMPPTAKGDVPPPTAGTRTAKKGDVKVTTDPHLAGDEDTGDVKVVKVSAKASDLHSDGGFSSGKPVQDPISGVMGPKASDGPTPAPSEKPALRPGDLNLVVRQITDKMELMAATRPKDGVTIMLQPERLGSITMTVKSVGGGVEAHISASDDNVRTALEQNRAVLGQSLADRGLKLDAVSIASQTRDSTTAQHQMSQQQQQDQQARQSQRQQSGHFFGSGREPLTTQQARQTIRSFDGVDLWI